MFSEVFRAPTFHAAVLAIVPALTCLASATAQAQIKVGENVHVSGAHAEVAHNETWISADPRNANNLVACSIRNDHRSLSPQTSVFVSHDGGRRWALSLDYNGKIHSGDPVCIFGNRSQIIYMALSDAAGGLGVFYSPDAGRTWEAARNHPFDIDRQFPAVDRSGGANDGRVYLGALAGGKQINGEYSNGYRLYRSLDEGRTFQDPLQRLVAPGNHASNAGNGVVLSDGTFLALLAESEKGEAPEYSAWQTTSADVPQHGLPERLKVLSTTDGLTAGPAVEIGTWHTDRRRGEGLMCSMAADDSPGPLKDRIYLVCPDVRSGRTQIVLWISRDKGKSWSGPRVISDDVPFDLDHPGKGPDPFSPAVAVNKHGVVGVSWYDRRNHPDNLGWDVRFAASHDGGLSWVPSVRVSSASARFDGREKWSVFGMAPGLRAHAPAGTVRTGFLLDGFFISAGHTAALAADAEGRFHALWVDNRTGVKQLWTAAISVAGEAIPNGERSLSGMRDVSDRVAIELSEGSVYDRKTGTISATARLVNLSKEPIRGPLVFRATALSSDLGAVQLVESDNGRSGAGAILRFELPDGAQELKASEHSRGRKLAFRLADQLPLVQGNYVRRQIVVLDGTVLAP